MTCWLDTKHELSRHEWLEKKMATQVFGAVNGLHTEAEV